MRGTVAVAKEADKEKEFSSSKSDNDSIHRVRDESEGQIGSLMGVIGDIRRDGGMPSVESIATELSGMPTGERAPALIALQQTHGNRYVQRVVSGIQAKLKVGQPGDKYEQEADRVADEVMRMPEPGVRRQAEEEEEEIQAKPLAEEITPLVQRQVEEENILQATNREDMIPEVSHGLESQINALHGGGMPLSESERAFFEPRFGVDFGPVRLHTDAKAAESARVVNAKAYTLGQDVVFGAGKYAPETEVGRQLLAHELVHVIQQGRGTANKITSAPVGRLQLRPRRGGNNVWFLDQMPSVVYDRFRERVYQECGWITRFRSDEGERLNDLLDNHSNLMQLHAQLRTLGRGDVNLVLRLVRGEGDHITYMKFSEVTQPAPVPVTMPVPVTIDLGPVEILHEEDILSNDEVMERIRSRDQDWNAAYNAALVMQAMRDFLNNVMLPQLPSFGNLIPNQQQVIVETRQIYRARRLARQYGSR